MANHISRRSFVSRGAAWCLPAIFVPRLIRANPYLGIAGNSVVASGGCSTAQDANTAAQNGSTISIGASTAKNYTASPFVATNSYDACKVSLYLEKVGAPTFTIKVSIWSDNGSNQPNALIGSESASFGVSAITVAGEVVYDFTISATGLVATTKYWVMMRCETIGDASNYINWFRNSVTGSLTNPIIRSIDGVTWTNESTTRRNKYQIYSA